MVRKNLQFILKNYAKVFRRGKTSGFTLMELLMAILVGSMVLYAMMSLVVSLLGTEKRETAKSQIEQQMSQAMDYIAADIQKAIYIYPGECLTEDNDGYNCRGLTNQITFKDVTPVLAFWKLEEVPYGKPATAEENLPETCTDFQDDLQKECYNLKTNRHSYTLVVYSLREDNPNGTWEGPARITRFELRKYDPNNLNTLTKTVGYQDPESPFGNWTRCPAGSTDCTSGAIAYTEGTNAHVLVDLVDQKDPQLKAACPDGYSQTPKKDPEANNFYACVKRPETSLSGSFQDAIIHLRGNAATRAGVQGSRNSVYLPAVQRQVEARTVFGRTPPKL